MTSPLRYVALGDSTAVGVGARHGGYPERLVRRAGHDGVGLELLNLAVAGATAGDVATGQLATAIAARPAIVTLGVGINDVTADTDLDAFARDLETIAAGLAGTGAKVVVANVVDLSRLPAISATEVRAAVRERTAALNERIAAAASRHGLTVADLFGWAASLEAHRELLSADGFHPSDAGYERWADAMEPAFLGAVRALAPGE
jgi:lysophospholipase L1-like esterase